MDESKANIDLAFRNGLKDYEVLPPPDVWNCIESRVMRKKKPVYLMRAAAFLAIAMTMSVLAYRWIGKTPTMPSGTVLTLFEESSTQVTPVNVTDPVTQIKPRSETSGSPQEITSGNQQVISEMPVADAGVSAIKLPYTNLRSPLKPASLDIIHHQTGFSGQQMNNLTTDNINQEYQDYLADNNTADKSGRWSIAALATPTYYGKINSGSDELSKQIMASEKSVISYTGGVALAYNVNKRFSIQSGLFYSSVGQEIDGINSFAGFQKYDNTKGDHNFEVLTTNGTVFTNNADVFLFADGNSDRIVTNYNNDVFDPQKASLDYINNTMRQDFSYLELPVFLRYKLIDRVVDFNLIGGLSYNLLLDNSVYTVIDGNKYMIGTTEGLNMFSLSSSLGMGMEYKFSEKLSLNLEPTFRYYLNTFNNVAGSNFHPYSFGIFSGISYKF
jgi:hypothetical protein